MPNKKETIEWGILSKEERKETFAKCINDYMRSLYWVIRKIVILHDDANDVLQNTLIKAWKSVGDFRGDSKFYSWLYRIAINESLTFLQKKKVMSGLSIDDNDSFLYDTIEANEDFDGDKIQKTLQKAILSLPEKQRIVFNMRYYEEIKYEEMEKILGTSVGALKASYHIALNKITSILKEELE